VVRFKNVHALGLNYMDAGALHDALEKIGAGAGA
jgi:hypothetical protein